MGKVMADSSQLKRVDPAELGDDDPFAELTRIMGFDPRVPVRPGASAPTRPQAEEPAFAAQSEPDLELSAEDFSIDLEKELLGDFAIDDEPLAATTPSVNVQEQALGAAASSHADDLGHDMDAAFAADLEGELLRGDGLRTVDTAIDRRAEEPEGAPEIDEGDFAIDDEPFAAAAPSPNVQEQALGAAASSHADGLGHDMDAAFAADLEGELLRGDGPMAVDTAIDRRAAEPEAAAPEIDEGDFAMDDEPAAAATPSPNVHEQALEAAAPSHAGDLGHDMDAAFAADLEGELLRNDGPGAVDVAIDRAAEPEAAPEVDEDDFDLAFATDLEGELLREHAEPAFDGSMAPQVESRGLESDPLRERAEPAPGETNAYPRQEQADDAFDEADFDAAFAVDDERMADNAEPVSFLHGEEEPDAVASADADDLDAVFGRNFVGEEQSEEFDEPVRFEDRRHGEVEASEEHELSAEDVELLAALEPDVMEQRFDDAAPPRGEAPRAAEVDDLDLDVAMADVDMDFGADAETPRQEGYGVHDGEPLQAGDIDFDDEDGAVFDGGVEEAQAEESPMVYVPAARADIAAPVEASADIAVSDVHDQEELSLEEELNALLGNSVPRAELTRGYDAPPLSASSASVVEHAPLPSAPAPDDKAYIDYAAYANDEEDFAGPSYQLAEVEHDEGDAALAEDELEFDDHAFDAAFENSLAADEYQEQKVNHDPYASLRQAASQTASHLHAAASNWRPAAAHEDIPDIETIDVPESATALADDLDIPELAYQDEVRATPAFDEFESEFAAVFADQPQTEEAKRRVVETSGYSDANGGYGQHYRQAAPAEADNSHLYAAGVGAAAAGAAAYASARPAERRDADLLEGFDEAAPAGSRGPETHADVDELDYDGLDEEIALPAYAEERAAGRRRGMMVAAIVGGVAVLGGVGAFALSFGGDGSDVPAIVRADDTPIKVRPENPGGTSVPNQDSKVYETVAGSNSGAQTAVAQPRLISSAEEPVDMAAKVPAQAPAREAETPTMPMVADEVADLPSGDDEIAEIASKAEDRVDPSADASRTATDNTEVAAVAPRRVRTMVVRPDGSLVPREDPAPAAAAEPRGAAEAMMETAPAKPAAEPQATNTTSASAQVPAAAKLPSRSVTSATPDTVPVAPPRPADQPIDVVGEVKPEQVAAVSQGASAGGWSMQIASQPSEDAAKSSYQDLSRRYASVIGGRDATIVKAEIAGKGTYWRVRIPAGSRNEAVSLCESYKSAGGNCFVSK
ncbi:sporulation protein [Mesorhizobium sp. L-8-10]|nr:sporulation protein [Mesorhizobium sp. L-8-10]